MTGVSPIRLWVMRAMYLFMAVGIGNMVWPLILSHDSAVPRMTGVAWALIGTIGLLAVLGLRYPLQMIPLLLVELGWKLIWLAAFALPRWQDGTLDEGCEPLSSRRPSDSSCSSSFRGATSGRIMWRSRAIPGPFDGREGRRDAPPPETQLRALAPTGRPS